MTAIVGVVENGQVWIGGDSAVSTDYYQMRKTHPSSPKVFYLRGTYEHVLVGVTGMVRMAQLVQYHLVGLPPIHPDTILEAWVISRFVPSVRKAMRDHGFIQKKEEREEGDGAILLGIRDHLYEVGHDFSVLRVNDPYTAIGSGKDYALGALDVLVKLQRIARISPVTRVGFALEAAASFCPYVIPPYTILSTHLPERTTHNGTDETTEDGKKV